MEKYKYSDKEQELLEKSDFPFAIYQFINKRVVTIVLSKGFYELFGMENMSKEEAYNLMDNNMYRDVHPDDIALLGDEAYRFATEGGSYDVIYRSKKDGVYRIIHACGKHIYKENGVKLALIWYTDQGEFIDDGKKEKDFVLNLVKRQLVERSFSNKYVYDYLTGLPAMSYFLELAEEGCNDIRSKGKIPAIIYTDYNGMKVYNQKYGLPEGDRLLKDFANKIIEIFSQENCSRFNADHFCIFTDEENAYKCTSMLVEYNKEKGYDSKISLRIGIYVYDDENISISGACDRAKVACDSGRNNYADDIYIFDPKMMAAIEDKQYVVENIDRAIKEGWIRDYYQPIVRTANGKVCHEEVLARWVDPKEGILSPAEFIPTLEETNTIYKLDLYILERALKKMEDQGQRGLHIVPVSVNLSRSDFYTCDIVEEIRKRVDSTSIPRSKIVIEITESIVANDIDYMIKQVKSFKELGFSVWMDDYGSGYSSPVILQNVPFDLIKIDMLFVSQLENNEKARIVLTETVRMAMALGLDTVAEGVETKEQAEFLNDIGCTMLQGYYFCKPVNYDDILERYEKGVQIGFENPDEFQYYAKLGKVNLYNLSIPNVEETRIGEYFNTWPMLMLEYKDDLVSVVKANISFKNYIKKYFPESYRNKKFNVNNYLDKPGAYSLNIIIKCAKDGKRVIIDDMTPDGRVIQLLTWRIAVNPVTKVAAVMVVVLSSSDNQIGNDGIGNDQKVNMLTDDIGKLKKENARLKEEAVISKEVGKLKKSVSDLLTNMPAMTFSKDVITRKYIACNQAFAEYAHKDSPEKVLGLTDFDIFDEQTAIHFTEDDKKALSMDKPYIFYEDVPDAAGNMRQFQTTKLRFLDETGRDCILGLCQDVTEAMRIKREYVEKLAMVQSMAKIDALTGIKNKNAYKEREKLMNQRILEHRQPEFAIVVMDVNNLKLINDTKGHEAGDKAICDACEIICKTFKRSPVFRVGGDEFVVISQDEDYSRSEELVKSIADYNKDAITNDEIVIACGMAKYDNEEDVATVFKKADQKMYENKKYLKESAK